MAQPSVRATSSASASALILLQVSARSLTLILNQLLVRLVSPSIFGLANIQLELLLSTILFLSRDGIRTILIRSDSASPASTQAASSGPRKGTSNAVHNVALLPIPIGLLLTLVASGGYAAYISPLDMRNVPTFHTSIALYAIGAVAELLYEPLLIRAVRLGNPALRVKAEGAAVLVKVLSTIATIILLPRLSFIPQHLQKSTQDEKAAALLAFGVGQALFGITMLLVHLLYFVRTYSLASTLELYLPRSDVVKGHTVWIDPHTFGLCAAMSQQAMLKHALTEADKFAVAKYASLEDQGGYALASNYGSLIARILFQPVEETARIVFSSSLPAMDKDSSSFTVDSATLERVGGMLDALFKMHLLLGAVMMTFGQPFSKALLYIMAGPQWALTTSAPAILAAYTFYLPIMGINGIAEGFVQSVANTHQVSTYNRVLLVASATFIAMLAGLNMLAKRMDALAPMAKVALVWANAFSIGVRAIWCWRFVLDYFTHADSGATAVENVRPKSALPSTPSLAVFGIVAAAMRMVVPRVMPGDSELAPASFEGGTARLGAIKLLFGTLGVALTGVGVVLVSLFVFERRTLVHSFKSLGRRKRKTQ